MSAPSRHHVLIDAPVEDVWSVVGDPRTHPEWWPEVVAIEAPERVDDGDAYVRKAKRLGFLDVVDNVWVAERVEELKEAHFRCTDTGTYARFALTEARGETFVELETGILPTNTAWRLYDRIGRPGFRRWARELMDNLPGVVERRRGD